MTEEVSSGCRQNRWRRLPKAKAETEFEEVSRVMSGQVVYV